MNDTHSKLHRALRSGASASRKDWKNSAASRVRPPEALSSTRRPALPPGFRYRPGASSVGADHEDQRILLRQQVEQVLHRLRGQHVGDGIRPAGGVIIHRRHARGPDVLQGIPGLQKRGAARGRRAASPLPSGSTVTPSAGHGEVRSIQVGQPSSRLLAMRASRISSLSLWRCAR